MFLPAEEYYQNKNASVSQWLLLSLFDTFVRHTNADHDDVIVLIHKQVIQATMSRYRDEKYKQREAMVKMGKKRKRSM